MTSAKGGYRWIERGYARAFWDVGATMAWGKLSLDLRYTDTNLSAIRCGFSDHCDGALVATLRYSLPLNGPRHD